jgi:chemosensory pili system protein ChpA (sensor histidine kinase/response regulator)
LNNNRPIELASIKFVLGELAPIMNDVRRAVVSTVESPEHSGQMEGAVGMLRKIQGTLHMLELYGAEMLAGEMCAVVEELDKLALSNRAEALEVLNRAALQLPDYLERIVAGSPDVPLELLPLLNDLRATRGRTLLSERVLLVADFSSGEVTAITRREDDEFAGMLRGVRLPYMQALLEWLKDDKKTHNLERMSKLFHDIENATHSESSRKIWQICRALVESLLDKGLSASVAIKFLLAQVERQLKKLLERGESGFVCALPVDLLNNLLYYIARSTSQSPLVAEIQREYRLGELLPGQGQLEQAKSIHQRPGIELLQIACQGVRDDGSKIVDLLEKFQRAGDHDLSMLNPLGGLLQRVNDTLSVLGMGYSRCLLEPVQEEILQYLNRGQDPGNVRLSALAALLLKVQELFEAHISEQTEPATPELAPLPEDKDNLSLRDLPEREYQTLIDALIQESLHAFTRTQRVFIDYSAQSANAHHIVRVPGLLKEVAGAFEILSNDLVWPLLSDLSAYFESRYVRGGVVPDPFEQQLIAQATTCMEYYIESIPVDGGRERGYILDVGRSALDQLISLDDSDGGKHTEIVNRSEVDSGQKRTVDGILPDAIDEKFLEVFVAEALDEMNVIDECLLKWRADNDDKSSLELLQRSFHTLKGSGRLIGAERIGEYAWRNENLLNYVLLGDLQPGDSLFALLEKSFSVLPRLIAELRGEVDRVDFGELIEAIDALIDEAINPGDSVQESVAPALAEEARTEVPTIPEGEIDHGIEPDLLVRFAKESRVHLETLEKIFLLAREFGGIVRPDDPLIRALHTLNGSAQTAQISLIAQLTEPLEKVARHKRELGLVFDSEESSLLKEAIDCVSDTLDVLYSGSKIPEQVAALVERIVGYADGVLADSTVEIDEGDGELRKIFIEEAEELVNATGLVLDQWRESPQDIRFVADMQRRLHTLKGGARMAGYKRVADLTHAFESSIVAHQATDDAPSDSYFDLLQEAVDALAVNLDQARNEQEIGRFNWIVSDLHEDTEQLAKVPPTLESESADERSHVDRQGAGIPRPGPETVSSEAANGELVPAFEAALKESTPEKDLSAARNVAEQSKKHIRVHSELLDKLVNNAGEVNIYHARFGQQISDMGFSLGELDQTVVRLREQLRSMDRETEAHIMPRRERASGQDDRGTDPSEADGYSQIQELSRSLLESVADLEDIKGTLADLTRDSETMLAQQSRVATQLQEGLLRTRRVKFNGIEARLSRIVRQTAQSLKKKACLTITGGENEIDRGVQERMVAPLEHLLRNAVAHGIESPDVRSEAGKPTTGKVAISMSLGGGDIQICVVDDGAGIDVGAVRQTAVERNLIDPDAELDDREILHLLVDSGFSTAQQVTQISGRGIGLDVAGREIKQLGGSLTLESEHGVGTMFVVRLPQMLAVSQALLVKNAGQIYALPVVGIRGISRENHAALSENYRDAQKQYIYADEEYQLVHLSTLLQAERSAGQPTEQVPLIMIRSGEDMLAVQVDELIGRREIVVVHPGAQASTVSGIVGVTLLGDGTVAMVLDIAGLLQTLEHSGVARELSSSESPPETAVAPEISSLSTTVLVVDDSITIRKFTTRMLERNNMSVLTAKDGVDAVLKLKERKPDLMLLDLEIPRMGGFEVAEFIRGDPRLKDLPIIIITSRSGEKHRQRAQTMGIDKFLGKPYQEAELIELISEVLGREFTSS